MIVDLPKTEKECRDHLDKCQETRCVECYYCENKLIHSSVENILASQG